MNKKFVSILKKVKEFPLVSIFTFLIAGLFLISMMPLKVIGASNEKSPLDVYTLNYSEGKWDGWMDSIVKSMSEYIVGPRDAGIPNTSSSSSGFNLPYVAEGGAIYSIATMSESFYQMPSASFIIWAQDQYYQVREGVSITAYAIDPQDTASYAPGIGYNILQPVLGLWQWTRNIVYGFYIIILIAIAFLILLRRPMGGQELVTLANSIPSVIISMVLVTFSYALCGLFIDAIYIGSNVVYNFLFNSPGAPGYELVSKDLADQEQVPTWTTWTVAGRTSGESVPISQVLQPDDPQMSVWSIFSLTNVNVCKMTTSDRQCSLSFLVPVAAKNNFIGVAIEAVMNLTENNLVGTVSNGLIELILSLATFQTAFKLFFMLLNNYLTLSFYPIIAPFIFLGAALPSQTGKTIGNFFKTLGNAALSFIVLYALFLLLIIFGYSAVDSTSSLGQSFNQAGQIKWVPPLLGYTEEQIFDGTTFNNNGANMITSLLVFGLFMATPNILAQVKKFLEVANPFQEVARTGSDISQVSKRAVGLVGQGAKILAGKSGIFSQG